jgi:quaternary ammonium compound-resistance protein SugE
LGTAYAVWVGIGAVGTIVFGIVARGEQTNPANLAALSLLVLSIVAVKLTAAH